MGFLRFRDFGSDIENEKLKSAEIHRRYTGDTQVEELESSVQLPDDTQVEKLESSVHLPGKTMRHETCKLKTMTT